MRAARLAQRGIEEGCTIGHLVAPRCPDPWLTRSEAAPLLVRAFSLEPAAPQGFADTAGNPYAADIDALFAAGVTVGCAADPLRFCPDRLLTRGELAAFLNRARSN